MTTAGINNEYTVNMQILTPLHVGGAQEKHLQEGLDFIHDHSKVYMLDQSKLLQRLNPYELSDILLSVQPKELQTALQREKIPFKEVSQQDPFYIEDVEFSEIKAFIKDGMQGQPYVPGSSLKGAIRSIIFAYLRGRSKNETDVLGGFERSIFRHIKVGDAFFDQLVLYPSKTFNLQGFREQWKGGWRHGNRNTNSSFKNDGSIFVYECLPPGTTGKLSIRILDQHSNLFKNLQQWDTIEKRKGEKGKPLPVGLSTVIQSNPLENLFKIINEHTLKYLQKEIAFFKYFPVAETPEILAKFEAIRDLIQNNKGNEWCVLRMAHGSGFHSITGDWQYPDGYTNPIDVHQFGANQGKKKYKSRKLLFSSGNFYPMGFVLLSLDGIEPPSWSGFAINRLSETEDSTSVTADLTPAAPVEPVFYKRKIQLNTELNAVVKKSGIPNQVQVYLNENEMLELPLLSYRSALDEGLVILVIVKSVDKKGKVREIGFSKIKS